MKLVAPISCGSSALNDLGDSESFDLGNNIVLAKTPDGFKNTNSGSILNFYHYYRDVRYCLIHSYQYPSEETNLVNTENLNKEPFESIRLANLALWLAKPNPASFDLLYHAEICKTGWECRGWRQVPEFQPNNGYGNVRLNKQDMETAQDRNTTLHDIRRQCPDSPVWFASRACYKALTESWWEARFLWFWIGLEALFCPPQEGKISKKLKNRLAAFLGSGVDQKELDDSYHWRSQIAHGKSLVKLGATESEGILFSVESYLQASLEKILGDAQLIKTFNNDCDRANYLKRISQ